MRPGRVRVPCARLVPYDRAPRGSLHWQRAPGDEEEKQQASQESQAQVPQSHPARLLAPHLMPLPFPVVAGAHHAGPLISSLSSKIKTLRPVRTPPARHAGGASDTAGLPLWSGEGEGLLLLEAAPAEIPQRVRG